MTNVGLKFRRTILAVLVGTGVLFVEEQWPFRTGASLIKEADARIGRPLTPLSYAGVARRTTRRAVMYGAAVGAATAPIVVAPAPVVVAPARTCVQAVDAYGRLYTRCY